MGIIHSSIIKSSLFIIFAAMLVIPSVAFSQGGWASVDYTLVLALHPRMAWYDFSVQRFYRSNIPMNNESELEKLRKKAAAVTLEMKSSVERVDRERNRILKEMTDLELSRKNTINTMLKENKDVTLISKSYDLKSTRLAKEYADKEKEYEKVRNAGLDVFYLNRTDSDNYLSSIMSEIDQILKQLSRERGNIAIIDRSFLIAPATTYQPPTAIPGFGLLGSQLYAQLLKTDFSVPKGSDAPETPPDHIQRVVTGIEGRFKEDLEKVLTQIPALHPIVANVRPRFFLAGGEDLTMLVIQQVFKLNKVPAEIEQRVLRLLPQMQ